MKTSIRYAKENDREKRERRRKKGRRRDIEREGEIRERGERDRESEREPVLSKPNPSPNASPKLCEWFSGREGDGSFFES
jgi:hypothetical protein